MQTIKLHNGVEMPCMVQTTNWQDYKMMKPLVREGLRVGFRAFDTARDYGNEPIVGRVMKECLAESGLKREDIFITTKIGNSQQVKGNIAEQVEISLSNLQTDYIDLWLMHWPYPNYYAETWRKMEDVYKMGKVRAIGMANFQMRHYDHLFKEGVGVIPHCVQFEHHPLRTTEDLITYLRNKNIAIQAYSPLCRMIEPVRNSEILNSIAHKYGKSIGQVILRWHYQHQTVPVFKTLKPHRLNENYNIWDFCLSDEDMSQIASMDQDYKYHIESASCPGY